MTFTRTYEYERYADSSEIEKEFEEKLSKLSTTTSKESASSRLSYLYGKPTVAEAVADLVERTGLAAYQKEIQALEKTAPTKTAQYVEQSNNELSIIDIPKVKEAISAYIKTYHATQLAPVINYVNNDIKNAISKDNNGSLGDVEQINKILRKDSYNDDPKLIIFITENILHPESNSLSELSMVNKPTSMQDNNVFDILNPGKNM